MSLRYMACNGTSRHLHGGEKRPVPNKVACSPRSES